MIDGKFNNNTFSFRIRQKNLSKSTKIFKISQTCFASWPRARINYSHESESVTFSLQGLKFNLWAVVLPIMLKADFTFELMLYIAIFVFLSPDSCFKSAICIQNSLESASIVLFSLRWKEGKIIHQKGLRASFTLILHSKATKTYFYVFPFHFKCQRSNLSV